MTSARAILLGIKDGKASVLDAGSTSELKRKARGYSKSGLPAGCDSIEVWSRTEGKIYREDGTRCPQPATKKAAKKAAKKVTE